MPRIPKPYRQDLSRSFFFGFIALLVALPMVFLFLVLLYENQKGAISDAFLIFGVTIWLLAFLSGLVIFVSTTQRRRKRWLDGVFSPLGLCGRRYMFNWWEYTGTLSSRKVKIRFYKGPTLDVLMDTPLQTRFVLSTPNELGIDFSGEVREALLRLTAPNLAGMVVRAIDREWFTRLADDPETADRMARLLNAGSQWALMRQLTLSPEELKLTLYRNQNLLNYGFTTEEVRAWLEDMLHLLEEAEAAPAPLIAAELTTLEKSARSGKLTRRAVLFALLLIFALSACFGLAMWALLSFEG